MNTSLRGKIAIVTGASRREGIGAAICRTLAAEGSDIFFTYWSGYDAEMPWGKRLTDPEFLANEIQTTGVRCASLELDLSQPTAITELFENVEAQLGPPTILVNNAAYSTLTPYDTLTATELDNHYAVNIRATLLLCVEFARRATNLKQGRIINLTSGQSLGPMPSELAYVATKGAIEAFTVSLATALGGQGITVNAVNPGPTDSGWMDDEIRQVLLPRFPQGRIGQPEDIARLISFLASEAGQWITGQIIHSEGGFQRG